MKPDNDIDERGSAASNVARALLHAALLVNVLARQAVQNSGGDQPEPELIAALILTAALLSSRLSAPLMTSRIADRDPKGYVRRC